MGLYRNGKRALVFKQPEEIDCRSWAVVRLPDDPSRIAGANCRLQFLITPARAFWSESDHSVPARATGVQQQRMVSVQLLKPSAVRVAAPFEQCSQQQQSSSVPEVFDAPARPRTPNVIRNEKPICSGEILSSMPKREPQIRGRMP